MPGRTRTGGGKRLQSGRSSRSGPIPTVHPIKRPHRGEGYFSFFSRRATRRVDRVLAGFASFSAVANGTPEAHHAVARPTYAPPEPSPFAGPAPVNGHTTAA